MYLLNDAIGLEHEKIATAELYYCAIVSCAGDHVLGNPQRRQKRGEEPVFADAAELHCGNNSGNASTVSEAALNNACIVIDTRMVPLHS